jgi:hypothetical protein
MVIAEQLANSAGVVPAVLVALAERVVPVVQAELAV